MECRVNDKLNKSNSEVMPKWNECFSKDKYQEVYEYTQIKHVYNKDKYPKMKEL